MSDALDKIVEDTARAHYATLVGSNLAPTPHERAIAQDVARAVAEDIITTAPHDGDKFCVCVWCKWIKAKREKWGLEVKR